MKKSNPMKVMPTADDGKLIRNPDLWGMWPFLPMKRRTNQLDKKDLGVFLATQEHFNAINHGGKFVIFHVYVFLPPTDKAEWDAAPRTEYSSIEEVLKDGWVVD